VRSTTIVISGLFLVAGFFPFSIPTLAFGIFVVAVLWPYQLKALEEIKNGGVPVKTVDNRWMTEDSPFGGDSN